MSDSGRFVAGDLNPAEIHQYVQGLPGQKFLKVAFGCGDEVLLHLGEPTRRATGKLADLYRGAWVFATQGTPWRLECQGTIVASSDGAPGNGEQVRRALESARVLRLDPQDPLSLTFDNGCRLVISPGPEDDATDVPYWELLTPEGDALAYSPNRVWSFTPSHAVRKAV
jgi:hypothetical protein